MHQRSPSAVWSRRWRDSHRGRRRTSAAVRCSPAEASPQCGLILDGGEKRNEVRQCPWPIICKPNSILRLPTRLIRRRDRRTSEVDEAGQLRTQVNSLTQCFRRSQDNIEIRRRGGTIVGRGRLVSEHLSKEQCSMADTGSEQSGQLSVGEVLERDHHRIDGYFEVFAKSLREDGPIDTAAFATGAAGLRHHIYVEEVLHFPATICSPMASGRRSGAPWPIRSSRRAGPARCRDGAEPTQRPPRRRSCCRSGPSSPSRLLRRTQSAWPRPGRSGGLTDPYVDAGAPRTRP